MTFDIALRPTTGFNISLQASGPQVFVYASGVEKPAVVTVWNGSSERPATYDIM
jgi:hypothetical protein